jgi:hypothetical protein
MGRKHTHAGASTYLLVVIIGHVHTLRHKVGNQFDRLSILTAQVLLTFMKKGCNSLSTSLDKFQKKHPSNLDKQSRIELGFLLGVRDGSG